MNKTMSIKGLKILALSLSVIGLTACKSLEIIHVPVGCIGQPVIPDRLNFTNEEADSISDPVLDKLEERSAIIRERINSQCEINKRHDEAHQRTKNS